MKKSLRTKLIAGTTAVALFSGAGFAFANTDAGSLLKGWYNSQFSGAKNEVNYQATAYLGGKTIEWAQLTATQGNKVTTDISGMRDSEISTKSSSISGKSAEHIANLNAARSEIIMGMGAQFDKIERDYISVIDRASHWSYKGSDALLAGSAKYQGSQAKKKVTQELNNAKDTAVNNLRTEIAAAKADVTAHLQTNKDASIQDLKNYMDTRYAELKTQLEAQVQLYIDAQTQILAAEALRIETEAMAELTDLVTGISNN